jgi:hypothetical protein
MVHSNRFNMQFKQKEKMIEHWHEMCNKEKLWKSTREKQVRDKKNITTFHQMDIHQNIQ